MNRSVFAVGALACVACCAGPIFGVLGGIAALGLVSTLFIGAAGLAIVAGATIAFVAVKRARTRVTAGEIGAVPVELTRPPS